MRYGYYQEALYRGGGQVDIILIYILKSTAAVKCLVDFLEMPVGDMGVDLGRTYALVPEQRNGAEYADGYRRAGRCSWRIC